MAAPPAQKAPQLPAFLRQSKAATHAKFIDLEWQQRDRLLQGTQAPGVPADARSQWSRLNGDAIAARNRYLNVEPFAQNRVKLKVAEGESDYINASPIVLGKRRYIATQGPKDTSVNHFYRMVAQEVQEPVVVVMLTQTHEAGREKCFQYYPLSDDESPLRFPADEGAGEGFEGEVVLEGVEGDEVTGSEIRRLRLRTTVAGGEVEEKAIHHLLFSGWPDFLIPEGEDRRALVELIYLSAHLNQPTPPPTPTNTTHTNGNPTSDFATTPQHNPRIIHCSAGVGRSGTFIALDYLLHLLHTGALDHVPADRDPVAETVDLLRQQRMMMVQGEAQFFFVYEVLREEMEGRLGIRVGAGGGGGDVVAGAGEGWDGGWDGEDGDDEDGVWQ
ncbi:hypothetical protein LTR08_002722 [Meristemomyces frigidus]|nr:hypothetical protein LTR08_002722 [Meristemomyces frigidus]